MNVHAVEVEPWQEQPADVRISCVVQYRRRLCRCRADALPVTQRWARSSGNLVCRDHAGGSAGRLVTLLPATEEWAGGTALAVATTPAAGRGMLKPGRRCEWDWSSWAQAAGYRFAVASADGTLWGPTGAGRSCCYQRWQIAVCGSGAGWHRSVEGGVPAVNGLVKWNIVVLFLCPGAGPCRRRGVERSPPRGCRESLGRGVRHWWRASRLQTRRIWRLLLVPFRPADGSGRTGLNEATCASCALNDVSPSPALLAN